MWISIILCITMLGPATGQKHLFERLWPQPFVSFNSHDFNTYLYDPQALDIVVTNPNNCSLVKKVLERFQQNMKQMYNLLEKKKDFVRYQEIGKGYFKKEEPEVQTTEDSNGMCTIEMCGKENSTLNYTTEHKTCALNHTCKKDNHETVTETKTVFPILKELKITIKSHICAFSRYPSSKMAESYRLDIDDGIVYLDAQVVWGAIKGLESLTQLFYYDDDFETIRIAATSINDIPKYRHRGLLLDTGHHYIPVKDILQVIEGMAMNKYNVFHWHIVDDNSFPYQSEVLPKLSRKGAYHPKLVYTKSDIKKIVEYARIRGIRIIPEFDIPAHVESMTLSYPELFVKCPGRRPSLNPLLNKTYEVLDALYKEVMELFPDETIHLGGRDSQFTFLYTTDKPYLKFDRSCWNANPAIQQYLKTFNLTTVDLFLMFYKRVVSTFPKNKTIIAWDGIIDPLMLSKSRPLRNAALQIYVSDQMALEAVRGKKFIIASKHFGVEKGFGGIYQRVFKSAVFGDNYCPKIERFVLGAELSVWTKHIDEYNLHTMLWPPAVAAAEVMWSSQQVASYSSLELRASEQLCRMRRRGIPPAELMPTVCLTEDTFAIEKQRFEDSPAGALL